MQCNVSWVQGCILVAEKLYECEIGHDSPLAAQLIEFFACMEGFGDDHRAVTTQALQDQGWALCLHSCRSIATEQAREVFA